MKIAVNTRFLLDDYLEGYGYFIYETFKRITQNHPEHEFIFIFDRPYNHRFIFSSNITPVVIGPQARHPLLWKWWYDIKIPSILKKYKADVFVSPDGFCSLTTKIPQCIVVHDLSFIHYPLSIKKSHLLFYKRFTPKFLKKAKIITTVSEFSKQDIIQHYKVDENKIDVVYSSAKGIFEPVRLQIKAEVKKKYTEDKEYFLHVGAIHPRKNLLNLLKAFSIFKKRQQSNFKLMLVGRLAWKYDSFLNNLKNYKYRADVILTGYLDEDELVRVMASAYAFVYPSFFEGFGVPVLEAMQCEVPVITSSDSAMQEIAGNAALYVEPDNNTDIGEKMMQIYKDEILRTDLVKNGKLVAQQFTWDKTATLLWQSICKCIP
ncbi:MAG: glycosyltransferase family 4 protein [Bacteroidota bacterium]|nr:glycosyltransferase family 4 protein [Bacteroidota bacterium]